LCPEGVMSGHHPAAQVRCKQMWCL